LHQFNLRNICRLGDTDSAPSHEKQRHAQSGKQADNTVSLFHQNHLLNKRLKHGGIDNAALFQFYLNLPGFNSPPLAME